MRVSASNYEVFRVNYEVFRVNYEMIYRNIFDLYYEDFRKNIAGGDGVQRN
jgi:hypothetical protein